MWHQGHISRTKKKDLLVSFCWVFRVFVFGFFVLGFSGLGAKTPTVKKKGKASVVVIVWERNFKALCLSLKSSKKRIAV